MTNKKEYRYNVVGNAFHNSNVISISLYQDTLHLIENAPGNYKQLKLFRAKDDSNYDYNVCIKNPNFVEPCSDVLPVSLSKKPD